MVAMVRVRVTIPMSAAQKSVVRGCLRGEERKYFSETLARLQTTFETMPKTYEQDGKGDAAIAFLHYFGGGSDWWITEKDMGADQSQAFGFTCLNGWADCAELGYIDLAAITAAGAELDFHFEPCTLGEIKRRIAV